MTKTQRLQEIIDNAHDEEDTELRHWRVEYVSRSGFTDGYYFEQPGWYILPNEFFYPNEHIFIGQWYREAKSALVELVKTFYTEGSD